MTPTEKMFHTRIDVLRGHLRKADTRLGDIKAKIGSRNINKIWSDVEKVQRWVRMYWMSAAEQMALAIPLEEVHVKASPDDDTHQVSDVAKADQPQGN
jgi:hypothetical protein